MKKTLAIVIFYLQFVSSIFPQSFAPKNLTFEHLSIEHGLSQITVHAIFQDSKGFLWFGTEDGLNRYDGYNFVVYQHDPSDTASLSDNFIWSIFEDSENNLWIGTNSGGLNKYSYSTNTFKNFTRKFSGAFGAPAHNIRTIFEDSDKNLWVGTENTGVFIKKNGGNKFLRYDDRINQNFSIRAICEDNFGNIWIGTNEAGLYNANPKKNKFL
jgi:ligand-binding sensor domain-containing protein